MNYKFDLQLFAAGDVVNKTTSNTTGNDLSDEMKTFYDKTLITLASPYLVHDQFGQKRDIPNGGGKTIEFRQFSSLPKALTPITEGVTPEGNKLNVTALTATIDQYGDYIEQTDLLELTAIDNTIVEATKMLASQAGLTMDTVVRNTLVGGDNVQYAPKVSGGSETAVTSRYGLDKTALLTVKEIFKAAAELKALNAKKINGDFVGIIHPYVAYDLMQSAGDNWVDVMKYAKPENILNGEIGKIGGVRFVESTEAKIFKSKPLVGNQDYLTVDTTLAAPGKTVVIKEVISEKEAAALAGRKILIDGNQFTIDSATDGAAGVGTITVGGDTNITTTQGAKDKKFYAGEAGKDNKAVFATLILGADAYGVTSVNGGGIEHIVKQKGYGNDPLNQRSSIGWKGLKVAKRLVEEYMIRVESCSSFSGSADAN